MIKFIISDSLITLTKNDQIKYFNTTINSLFNINNPEQLLFSFLCNDKCIGYGGLVHINWSEKKAEISFIMDTQFEKLYFEKYWSIFLRLIEEVAFKDLNFKNIFVYAFDLREHLYGVLSKNGFIFKSRINKAYKFKNLLYDVVIYNKLICMKIALLISGDLGFIVLKKIIPNYKVEFVMTDKNSNHIKNFCQKNKIPLYEGNLEKFIRNIL